MILTLSHFINKNIFSYTPLIIRRVGDIRTKRAKHNKNAQGGS